MYSYQNLVDIDVGHFLDKGKKGSTSSEGSSRRGMELL